jgi:hypothetical protein
MRQSSSHMFLFNLVFDRQVEGPHGIATRMGTSCCVGDRFGVEQMARHYTPSLYAILSTVYCDSHLSDFLTDDDILVCWGADQPNDDFFVQSAILHSTYYYLQILVHRPFIPLPKKPSTSSFPSLAICTNAARKIIQIGLVFEERMCDVPSYMPVSIEWCKAPQYWS